MTTLSEKSLPSGEVGYVDNAKDASGVALGLSGGSQVARTEARLHETEPGVGVEGVTFDKLLGKVLRLLEGRNTIISIKVQKSTL